MPGKIIAIGHVVVNKEGKISDLVMLTFYRMHRKFMFHFSVFSNQATTPVTMIYL